MNLQSWLDYIGQLHVVEIDLGLERIKKVVEPLGWHRFNCPVITVTGTNGKGSCVKFLENIFSNAGYRVGAFTSPHLMRFNERVRVNNQEVDDQTLIEAFVETEQSRLGTSLSFFEFTFLSALKIFQQQSLDLLILEVGLGGRLDAVNIVDANIAVVTTIDLDHMDWLGPDRNSIAAEKAGIFRFGNPVICGDPNPPENLQTIARQLRAPWYGIGNQFDYSHSDNFQWQWRSAKQTLQQLPEIKLKHQNAAVSLMAVELLQNQLPVTTADIHQGLSQAFLPGRFEAMQIEGKNCYLDVAHNPQGGRWLAEQCKKIAVGGKIIAVLGMLADKDIAGTIKSLLHYADRWYVATLSTSRGADALKLQTVLREMGVNRCYPFTTVVQALQAALSDASLNDSMVIFGSFYTVAFARQYFLERSE